MDHGADVEILRLPTHGGRMAPAAIVAALAERGFRRILVEGGAKTVSRFLAAGCLDRLHVVIAPDHHRGRAFERHLAADRKARTRAARPDARARSGR